MYVYTYRPCPIYKVSNGLLGTLFGLAVSLCMALHYHVATVVIMHSIIANYDHTLQAIILVVMSFL